MSDSLGHSLITFSTGLFFTRQQCHSSASSSPQSTWVCSPQESSILFTSLSDRASLFVAGSSSYPSGSTAVYLPTTTPATNYTLAQIIVALQATWWELMTELNGRRCLLASCLCCCELGDVLTAWYPMGTGRTWLMSYKYMDYMVSSAIGVHRMKQDRNKSIRSNG